MSEYDNIIKKKEKIEIENNRIEIKPLENKILFSIFSKNDTASVTVSAELTCIKAIQLAQKILASTANAMKKEKQESNFSDSESPCSDIKDKIERVAYIEECKSIIKDLIYGRFCYETKIEVERLLAKVKGEWIFQFRIFPVKEEREPGRYSPKLSSVAMDIKIHEIVKDFPCTLQIDLREPNEKKEKEKQEFNFSDPENNRKILKINAYIFKHFPKDSRVEVLEQHDRSYKYYELFIHLNDPHQPEGEVYYSHSQVIKDIIHDQELDGFNYRLLSL